MKKKTIGLIASSLVLVFGAFAEWTPPSSSRKPVMQSGDGSVNLAGGNITNVVSIAGTNDNVIALDELFALIDSGGFDTRYLTGFTVVDEAGGCTSYTSFSSANAAVSAGETLYLPTGFITNASWAPVSGVTYVGKGTGWFVDGEVDLAGGTVFVGTCEDSTQSNYVFNSVGFYCGTNVNSAMLGGYSVDVNATLENVNIYGSGTNTHNIELRGGGWTVKRVGSYNAGTHPFPIKVYDSTFEDIHVVAKSGGANSGFFFKAQDLDMYNITVSRLFLENNTIGLSAYDGRVLRDVVISDSRVTGATTGGMGFTPISSGIVSNITIIGCQFDDCQYGSKMQGSGNTSRDQTREIHFIGTSFYNDDFGIYNHATGVLGGSNIFVRGCSFYNVGTEYAGLTDEPYIYKYGQQNEGELDATYATAAQGALADTSLQPADNQYNNLIIGGEYLMNGATVSADNYGYQINFPASALPLATWTLPPMSYSLTNTLNYRVVIKPHASDGGKYGRFKVGCVGYDSQAATGNYSSYGTSDIVDSIAPTNSPNGNIITYTGTFTIPTDADRYKARKVYLHRWMVGVPSPIASNSWSVIDFSVWE
jgi:hypothetical protein